MATMKLKTLEQHLQQVEGFQTPKVDLEQYATTPHLAASMLYTIENTFGDLSGKAVADLGCGCGTLSFGATLLDAAYICGIDVDPDAIETFIANRDGLEVTGCDAVLRDVTTGLDGFHDRFDTVVSNPPFGTRRPGVDIRFVEAGLRLATTAVYSLHKRATRKHVLARAEEWGVSAEAVAELRFDLPRSYRFHKKSSVDIEVDLIRFWFEKPKAECAFLV